MKKIVLFLIPVLLILVVFLLPSEKINTHAVNITCPMDAVTRLMVNKQKWEAWWPGSKINDSSFEYRQKPYLINTILLNGFKASTREGDMDVLVELNCLPVSSTETQFSLTTSIRFSSNPFKKTMQYISLFKTNEEYAALLNQIQTYFSTTEKVYGYKIDKQKVKHSSLISVKETYDHYPTVAETYLLVDELKKYIADNNSKEMDAPILNVFKLGDTEFQAMAAIATDRDLPSDSRYFLKNMMLGNIIVAEVTGPMSEVNKCQLEIENYVRDYRKVSPAIPFQRLITNRITEPDSTKWVTTLNYPVFN